MTQPQYAAVLTHLEKTACCPIHAVVEFDYENLCERTRIVFSTEHGDWTVLVPLCYCQSPNAFKRSSPQMLWMFNFVYWYGQQIRQGAYEVWE